MTYGKLEPGLSIENEFQLRPSQTSSGGNFFMQNH